MSSSVRPHRQHLTRLPHPWDSPSKNTGVGCHFLLQCMKVKSENEVAQSCPTYSAYKLNKQGDNVQPWRTPFPVWNQSVVLCRVLTVASWPAYRFLRRQVRSSSSPIFWRIFQFVVIHTVKGFGVNNKAEVDVFLEFSCFLYHPEDVW